MRAAPWSLFAALFAVAQLLHQLWWHGFEVDTPRTLIVAASAWLLVRPSSVGRFALLLAVLVAVLAADLPFVMSHLLVVMVVGVVVLIRLAGLAWRRRTGPADAHDALAGFLRTTLLITYVVAAVAKLNSGFLDPATSCAGPMTAAVTWFSPGLVPVTPDLLESAIVGTVVVELALPVLLAVPYTRLVGLVVGGGFHLVLAAAGNVPFTALAFAFYALFLPPGVARRLVGWFPPGARWAALLIVPLWLGGARLGGATDVVVGDGTRVAVLVVALAAAAALLGGGLAPQRRALGVGSPVLVLGLAVLLANGASPYLGFKTDGSLEMFSNLRTEPGAWNHIVLPESVRHGTLQVPVRVAAATDPALVARTAGPDALVRGEVERTLRASPGSTAFVVEPDGRGTVLGPFPDGPTLADRVAYFRAAPPPDVPRC